MGEKREISEMVLSNALINRDLELGESILVGIDEAGRGALAGPVVVAAVSLRYEADLSKLNDSKKLSSKVREQLFEEIITDALDYSIIELDSAFIDEHNILQASLKGMALAAKALKVSPGRILVDGPYIPKGLWAEAVVKGDSKYACIAAASVLAKVYRDRLMTRMAALYPGYGFERHKGYGTREHLSALSMMGPSPIHRLSFEPLRQLNIWTDLKST